MTKVEKFKNELKELILNATLRNNKDILIYTYEAGHLPSHAKDALKDLKIEKKISYLGKTSGVNYQKVFKLKNIVEYLLN